MMGSFFCAIVWLELVARIAGPKNHGPYLVSFTAGEPMTKFEDALYSAVCPDST